MQTKLKGQYSGKSSISLVYVSKPQITVITAIIDEGGNLVCLKSAKTDQPKSSRRNILLFCFWLIIKLCPSQLVLRTATKDYGRPLSFMLKPLGIIICFLLFSFENLRGMHRRFFSCSKPLLKYLAILNFPPVFLNIKFLCCSFMMLFLVSWVVS